MPDISEVKICNLALAKLGEDRISSLTEEDNKVAQLCNLHYEHVRDDVLTDAIWNFAQRRVALAQLDETPAYTEDLMTIVYSKPPDYLKLNFVNIEFARVKVEADNKILSDTAQLKIKYTARITNPVHFFSKFVEALAARLAAELAFPITASRTLAADLFKIYYDKKLPAAESADAQQGTPQAPMQDEWNKSRVVGAGTLVGRTGDETWFPITFF